MKVEELRKKLNRLRAERDRLVEKVDEEQTGLTKALARTEGLGQAQKITQAVAEAVQRSVHERVAGVVGKCLKAVFGEDAYEFKINFTQKRGRTEATLTFVRDGLEVDPISGAGGGVVDIAAFALRLACLVLSRPKKRRLVVADEPFRFVSREYRPAVRELLVSLAEELGFQFVLVTHDPALRVGKVVDLPTEPE